MDQQSSSGASLWESSSPVFAHDTVAQPLISVCQTDMYYLVLLLVYMAVLGSAAAF